MKHARVAAPVRRRATLSPSRRLQLSDLSADIVDALEDVNVPSYIIDSAGIIRWVNQAGRRLVGDVRGMQFTSVIFPDDVRRSREVFSRMILKTSRTADDTLGILGQDGTPLRCEVCSVALMQGHRVIGIFGQIPRIETTPPATRHPKLTPRQTEVLHLLMHGRSTDQIADELSISIDTVRNHIRHLMRALGVNSRLQAVAVARREHL